MSVILAVAHLGGSVFALLVLGGLAIWVGNWDTERVRRRRREELTVSLGVPANDLEKPEMAGKLLQISGDRFSSELLRNRLSDLCGSLRTGWNWLGSLVQIGVLFGVAWNTITEGAENAVYAWSVVPVAIFFWLASLSFSFMCHLLTGRYPGEAKQGRKALATYVQVQHREVHDESRDAV
jgi:hypothetical protein